MMLNYEEETWVEYNLLSINKLFTSFNYSHYNLQDFHIGPLSANSLVYVLSESQNSDRIE